MPETLLGSTLLPWQGRQIEVGISVESGQIVLRPELDGDLSALAERIALVLTRAMKD
jgi:hypothetical protein